MKNYLQLLSFEFNRIYKLYVTILIIVFVIQTGGVITSSLLHKSFISHSINTGMKQQEIVAMYGPYSLWSSSASLWFAAPVVLAIVAIMFYSFFIWYRDWLGKNTFIYRLLMLPTNRMNVFFAKLTTIMFSVLSLVAIQYVLLIFYSNIVKWIIPVVYRLDMKVTALTASSGYLNVLMPSSLIDFMKNYSIGLLAIILLFVVILLERSYRIAGIVLGLAYVFGIVLIMNLPNVIQYIIFDSPYFYPGEFLVIQTAVFIIVTVFTLVVGNYLIKNKVTV